MKKHIWKPLFWKVNQTTANWFLSCIRNARLFYLFIYDSGIRIVSMDILGWLGFPIIPCFCLHFSHSLYTLWATAAVIRLDIPAVFVTQSESLQARKTASVLWTLFLSFIICKILQIVVDKMNKFKFQHHSIDWMLMIIQIYS